MSSTGYSLGKLNRRQGSTTSKRSEYDATAVLDPDSASHPIVEMGVRHKGGIFHSDLQITSSKSTFLYYVQCQVSPVDGFAMILHSGDSKFGPVVGGCRIDTLSLDITMLFGDPSNMSTATYEKITAKSATIANFRFIIPMASGSQESFEWRRSHGRELRAAGGKRISMRNMVLVKLADEKVYGVYVDNLFTGFSKRGKIQLREVDKLGERGQLTAVLAILSINEKLRRHLRGTAGFQAGGKFPI